MIEQAIRTILTETAGVTDICGQNIFYGYAKDTANKPYVLISCISADPQYSMEEELTDRETVYSIDCYSSTQMEAIQLANAVITALGSYVGTKNSIKINGIFFENYNDITNHFADNKQACNYGRSLTAQVHYNI